RGAAAWESISSLPYGLPFLDGDGLLVEHPAIIREDPALQVSGAPGADPDDDVREPRPRMVAIERGRCGRVVRVGMIHPDHLESVAIQSFLRAAGRRRVDQVTVARRVGPLVGQRD